MHVSCAAENMESQDIRFGACIQFGGSGANGAGRG
jgi:hypothetical protein